VSINAPPGDSKRLVSGGGNLKSEGHGRKKPEIRTGREDNKQGLTGIPFGLRVSDFRAARRFHKTGSKPPFSVLFANQ
jgi:hypothetical protein